jgi:hypothetical protein
MDPEKHISVRTGFPSYGLFNGCHLVPADWQALSRRLGSHQLTGLGSANSSQFRLTLYPSFAESQRDSAPDVPQMDKLVGCHGTLLPEINTFSISRRRERWGLWLNAGILASVGKISVRSRNAIVKDRSLESPYVSRRVEKRTHQERVKRLSHRQLTGHRLIFNKGKERRSKDDVDSPGQAVILVFPGKGKIHPAANHQDSEDVHAPFGESPHEDANLPRIHAWTLSREKDFAHGQQELEQL